MKRRNAFIITTWWVIVAASLCVLRPNGSMKAGLYMFALVPFALVIDIVRRKFSAALKAPPKPGSGPT